MKNQILISVFVLLSSFFNVSFASPYGSATSECCVKQEACCIKNATCCRKNEISKKEMKNICCVKPEHSIAFVETNNSAESSHCGGETESLTDCKHVTASKKKFYDVKANTKIKNSSCCNSLNSK